MVISLKGMVKYLIKIMAEPLKWLEILIVKDFTLKHTFHLFSKNITMKLNSAILQSNGRIHQYITQLVTLEINIASTILIDQCLGLSHHHRSLLL
jgi:hypothetical protein